MPLYVVVNPWTREVYSESRQRWRAIKRLRRLSRGWDDCPLVVKEIPLQENP